MKNNLAKTFIQRLAAFEHEFDGDPRWELVFSNGRRKWFYLIVSYYNGAYYITEHINGTSSIEVDEHGEMAENARYGAAYSGETNWPTLFSFALEHLDRVEKDWVGEYRQREGIPGKYCAAVTPPISRYTSPKTASGRTISTRSGSRAIRLSGLQKR
ncbi:MAG: hypothetical protein HUU34_10770 [Saprospiraceae bacterium]|nr:hypothetical protein [Saprospiraceae bacterium]